MCSRSAETLALAAWTVLIDRFAGLNGAGIDTDERQTCPTNGSVITLKTRRGRTGAVHVRGESDLFVRLGVHADNGRNIQRRGQDNRQRHRAASARLCSCRTYRRGREPCLTADGRLADGRAQTCRRGSPRLPDTSPRSHRQSQRYGIDELFPVLGGQIRHVLGDGLHAHILTQIVVDKRRHPC